MDTLRIDLTAPLLNAAQVAELLGIPRSSVYEYARRQHEPLPSVAIGRHRRFVREDIEAWLFSKRLSDRPASVKAASQRPNSKQNGAGQARRTRRRTR
jgi:excisionase family DNA binding protein